MRPKELLDGLGPQSRGSDAAPLLDHRDTAEAHLLALLRKRELAPPVIEAVARHDRWNKRHAVRAAIVGHVKTPRTLALRMIPLLFWKEQLRVATNIRLAMPLRVAAESRLKERLPELELGERISMAHAVPVGLIPVLAEANDPRVIRTLLRNPRMREPHVMGIVSHEETSGPVLRVVAQSERWICRPPVRLALVEHPNTPVHVALNLMAALPPKVLSALAASPELRPVVAIRAERILAQD